MMKNNNRRIHKQLLILLLISILPVIAGWSLYFGHSFFQFNTVNHGTLINPPINVQGLYTVIENQKKWLIVYLTEDTCDTTCKKIDYQLHQVQKALGKNSRRVSVLSSNKLEPSLNKLNFPLANKIYLIDPLGNLFMYYPASTNPMNIFKDVTKLLEISQIG